MSRTSKALLEERGQLVHKMQELLAAADAEDRGLNAEERETFDQLDADQQALKTRADDAYKAEQLAAALAGERTTGAGEGGLVTPAGEANFARHLRTWLLANTEHITPDHVAEAQRDGFPVGSKSITLRMDRGGELIEGIPTAPRTLREIEQQYEWRRANRERRAQSVGTTTAGGFTVPDEMMRSIDTALLAFGGMRQASSIISTGTGADLPIPTSNDTANKGEIIAENTAVNEQDLTFGQVILQAFKYSSKMIKVSVELLQDASINVPSYIGARLGERLGRITNDHFTTGTGTGQPRGIVTAAVDSTFTITAGSINNPSYDNLMDLKHSVDPAYRAGASWMMHDTILKGLKKLKDGDLRPLWKASLSEGTPDSIDNDPVIINQSMPIGANAKCLLYGLMSKYMIRETRDVVLLRLDERFAELHQVAFLAFMRMDGDLIDAGTGPVKFLDNPAT